MMLYIRWRLEDLAACAPAWLIRWWNWRRLGRFR